MQWWSKSSKIYVIDLWLAPGNLFMKMIEATFFSFLFIQIGRRKVREPANKIINTFYDKVLIVSSLCLNKERLEIPVWRLSVGDFGS